MALGSDNLNQDAALPSGAVTIKVFANATTAEAAAALFEANGIACWLHADDCGGMLPVLDAAHGVKLLVNPADADSAMGLLTATPLAPPQELATSNGSRDNPAKVPQRPNLALLQILAGLVVGVLLCLLYQWTAQFGTRTYPSDSDSDGKADEITVYKDGRLIEQHLDRNFDGKIDAWNYYDHGYLRKSSTADDNFDGKIDVTWNYTNGVPTTSTTDTDFNGTPDVTCFFKNDLCTKAEWRPNGTNVITLRQLFQLGRLAEESRDTNMDGSFDVTIRYDAFQNPISTNTPLQLRTFPP